MASKVTLMLVLLVVIFISNIEAGLRQNKYKKKDLSHLTKSMIQKLSVKPKQSVDKVVITRKPVNQAGKKKQIIDDEGSNAEEDVSNDIDSNHSNDAHGGHKHHGNKDEEIDDKKADSDDGNDDIDDGGDDNDDDENDINNNQHDIKKKPHFVCLPGRTVLKASGGFHPNINPEPKPGPKPTPKPDGKSTPKPKPKETLNDSDEAEEPASDEDQMLRTHMNKGKKKEKSEQSEIDSEEEAEKKHKNKNRNKNKNKNGRGDEDDADADAKEDVFCQVCVCAVNGIDEYCSNRPALNVNECIRIAKINQERAKNLPFEVDRTLAYRIRRDLMWHKDDIPYSAKAHCVRGSSYYSNSVSANNTDIDVADDIDSLLDYSNEDVCYFCICSVGGTAAGCVHRDPWYCNYYRHYKSPNAIRDMYADLFKKDAPSYFQSLSHRVRRTMDRQVFELYDSGGDALCCGHPDGHRRTIHNKVHSKMMSLKRKIPKENLMSKNPGGDYVDFIVNND